MTQLSTLREAMTGFLTDQGLAAVTGWPDTDRSRITAPLAVVSLHKLEAGQAGFRHYLGEYWDEASGAWLERYGRRVSVHFRLDLYSPKTAGAAGCQTILDQLAEVLHLGTPAGLSLQTFSWGDISYDQSCGAFRVTAEALCQAFLYAESETDGQFLSFDVRGEIES